jgi:hypothetical protein
MSVAGKRTESNQASEPTEVVARSSPIGRPELVLVSKLKRTILPPPPSPAERMTSEMRVIVTKRDEDEDAPASS